MDVNDDVHIADVLLLLAELYPSVDSVCYHTLCLQIYEGTQSFYGAVVYFLSVSVPQYSNSADTAVSDCGVHKAHKDNRTDICDIDSACISAFVADIAACGCASSAVQGLS